MSVNHWNKVAPEYEAIYNLNGSKRLDRKIDMVTRDIVSSDIVAELCCGTGMITRNIHCKKLYAIDSSIEMIKVAKKNCIEETIEFINADISQIPLEDSSVNVACGVYILMYTDIKNTMKEIYRILKPNGRIVFIELNELNPYSFAKTHFKKLFGVTEEARSFTESEIRNSLRGFTDISIKQFEFGPVNFLENTPIRHFACNHIIEAKKNG
jgi:ubiquinone/menaquinone biosynthesis C-methylase UbiE